MDRELSLAEQVADLTPSERDDFISALAPTDLRYAWWFWGRKEQFAPPGNWSTWLILAGRGFGKTRTGSEWLRDNMCGSTPLTGGRWRHVALIAETAADARDVMVGDGKAPSDPTAGSGVLQVHPKDFLPHYEPSKRRLTWPNGAAATLYNAVEPDQLRGPQHDAAWCDELCKWRYARETWDQLQFGLRTGLDPRVLISTTPKPTLLLKEIIKESGTVITRGATSDNSANLAGKFLARIEAKYAGTRLGRQELQAEILEDLEGALWKRSVLDECRVQVSDLPPLRRVVIAIDPAVSSEEHSNETGIVAVALGEDGRGYVLDDISGVYAPLEWANEAISLYRARGADRIVAEINQGGAMVEETLRTIDRSVSYTPVWAARGKFVRAEPISSLYQQKRISHVGSFPLLEDQMCAFTTDFNRKEMGTSPDRVDALVWGLTELFVEGDERRPVWTSV